jgi:hypothetical protein
MVDGGSDSKPDAKVIAGPVYAATIYCQDVCDVP